MKQTFRNNVQTMLFYRTIFVSSGYSFTFVSVTENKECYKNNPYHE